jgi:predicted TIM-barrel fold metal-dependent hydrolase
MAKADRVPVFDCDNHYYEAPDAFTRYVPEAMRGRCLQWAEIDGRQRHVIGGQVDFSVGNPLFDPVAKPGILYDYYNGNPEGRPAAEMMRGNLEAQPACYRSPAARLEVMDAQGLDAIWLFPTLGVLYEELIKDDVEAVCAMFEGFNRWLAEDWGLAHADRIFCAPYISLADVDWACREVEWAIQAGARTLVMRPAAIQTTLGVRAPSDPHFDPFWSRINEAGITLVVHTGNSGYSTNGYASDAFSRASIGMSRRPSVKNLSLERAAHDFLITLSFDKLYERFPNLRIASVENGSQFVPGLMRTLEQAKHRNPWHFGEDPVELFRRHVFMNPFWEDDIADVVEWMGAKNVIFGSDWPHMEGLPDPGGIFAEVESFDAGTRAAFLNDNTRALNTLRPA